MQPGIKRVALIDTFLDEKFECLNVAEALGKRLFAVRFDTPSSRRGNFYRILEECRWELDMRGYNHIKFYASGGIKEEDVPILNPVVDGYGIGTSISNAPVVDYAMDIMEVEGKPRAKRGKWSGSKRVLACQKCGERRIVPHRAVGRHRVNAGRFARLKAMVNAAANRPESERARYLDEACAGDAEMRAEVESLLAHRDELEFQDQHGMVATYIGRDDCMSVPRSSLDDDRIGSVSATTCVSGHDRPTSVSDSPDPPEATTFYCFGRATNNLCGLGTPDRTVLISKVSESSWRALGLLGLGRRPTTPRGASRMSPCAGETGEV